MHLSLPLLDRMFFCSDVMSLDVTKFKQEFENIFQQRFLVDGRPLTEAP